VDGLILQIVGNPRGFFQGTEDQAVLSCSKFIFIAVRPNPLSKRIPAREVRELPFGISRDGNSLACDGEHQTRHVPTSVQTMFLSLQPRSNNQFPSRLPSPTPRPLCSDTRKLGKNCSTLQAKFLNPHNSVHREHLPHVAPNGKLKSISVGLGFSPPGDLQFELSPTRSHSRGNLSLCLSASSAVYSSLPSLDDRSTNLRFSVRLRIGTRLFFVFCHLRFFQDCHIPLATLPASIPWFFRNIATFAKIATQIALSIFPIRRGGL
jgi:hypothetical protein